MKINNKKSKSRLTSYSSSKSRLKNGSDSVKTSFNSILKIKNEELKENEISSLISEIEAQGKILEKNPIIKEYNKYKDLIQKILQKTIMKTFSIKKKEILQKDLSRKEYIIVQTINQELESLLTMLRNKEMSHIALAEKIVKMKGLIIDIFN